MQGGRAQSRGAPWGSKGGSAPAWKNNSGSNTAAANVQSSWKPAAASAGVGTVKPPPAAQSSAAKVTGKSAFKITSTKQDVVTKTLMGDYIEKGSNHGRKYYQKAQRIAGHEDVDVFLYYWDNRDGTDFSGWWFGDQLGGTQVWARAANHGTMPPKVGWLVPWDATRAEPGALIVEPVADAAQPAQAGKAATTPAAKAANTLAGKAVAPPNQAGKAGASGKATPAAANWQQRAKKISDEIKTFEAAANNAVAAAKRTAENKAATETMLKIAMESIQKQQTGAGELIQKVTKEVAEARKAGPSEANTVAELNKQVSSVRTLQSTLGSELFKVKGLHLKAQNEQKRKDEEKQQKMQAEKDARDFKVALPKAKGDTAKVESEVEKVVAQAAPLISSPLDKGDALTKQIEKVEVAAEAAQKKLAETRAEVGSKLAAARNYKGDTKAEALKEFGALQAKLNELQKKLLIYKAFKKEYPACLAARKALAEVVEKLAKAEPEIEEVANMCKGVDAGEMSQDEVTSADKGLGSALSSLNSAMATLNQRSRGADAATSAELEVLKKRGGELRTKLDAVTTKLKGQKQALSVQASLASAREKVVGVETLLSKCQQAEMPFLKGIEVLPKEESDQAIGASEKAGGAAFAAVNQAKQFLKNKLGEAKKFSKEVADSMTDQLTPLVSRAEVAEAKIASFRKETSERKTNAILAEAVDSVGLVEKHVGTLADLTSVLSADKLEESPTEKIKDAVERCGPLEKDASAVSQEARKIVAAKQREAKGGDAAAALKTMNERLNAANEKLNKQRQAIAVGTKLIKTREVLEHEGDKLAQAEAHVDKMQQVAPAADAEITEDVVKVIDEATISASKILKGLQPAIQPHLSTAPAKTKAAFQELLGRRTKAQEKLEKIKSDTKDRRETTLGKVYLAEAEAKTDALDAAIEKTGDAELPYLRGIEILPFQEAVDTVAACEKAAAAAQEVLSQARSYIAAKTVEAKTFGAAKAKHVTEGFAKLTLRINDAAQKLSAFSKETAARKKTAQIQEAAEKVSKLEELVSNVTAAAEPFEAEGAKDMSEEAAAAPLETFLEAEKAAKENLTKTRAFLMERQRASGGNAGHVETLKQLQKRVTEAQAGLDKAKGATGAHEMRFRAKRLFMEATEKVATLDDVVKTATEACAPLTEKEGEEFLIETSVRVLATALGEHMKEKNLNEEDMFKKACADKKKLSEAVFTNFVRGLPESIAREEVNFPEARVGDIFKRIDADRDGAINLSEFKSIFRQRGVVKKGISVTDGFAIASSKTVGKVEPGDEVELVGVAKEDDAQMFRSACKLVKDDKDCWITVKGNQGAIYVQNISPFDSFCTETEKALKESDSNVAKVSAFLGAKLNECRASSMPPMKEAREDIAKLQPKLAEAAASIKALRTKISTGKVAFKSREKAELNAHIEAKERKEAEAITGVATSKVEAAEGAAKAVEDAAQPITSLAADAVEAFATPASVAESVEKFLTVAIEKTEDARKVVKEQLQVAIKVSPPTKASTAARSQLQKMQGQLEKGLRAAQTAVATVKSKCSVIVERVHGAASKALRDYAQKKGIDVEKLYAEIAGKSKSISEQSFCKKLASLEGLTVQKEHARLLFKKIGSGGMSLRHWLSFVQVYYAVVKDVALTDVFDMGSCNTVRKVDKEEIVEVVEGPVVEEKFGMERVRAKCILDGAAGWLTIKGNQGTAFLRHVEKPFLVCCKEQALQKDCAAGSGAGRVLKEDEVLEVIEGPKEESFPDIRRARVKLSKDGTTGWVTLRDKNKVTLAEPNTKLYICKSSVAMTDSEDVKTSKVVRKLAVDEMFEASGELKEDTEAGIFRVCGKALKDGKEGWITTKGNAGTVFAESTTTIYSVQRCVEMHKRIQSVAAEVVRTLEVGETFQVVEGPRDEMVPVETRVKVRAVSDKAVGWVTKGTDLAKTWTPIYRCLAQVALQDTRGATEVTKTLRELAKGELFELLEGPVEEGKDVRIKGRANKDGVTGWVTLRGEDGKRRLDC